MITIVDYGAGNLTSVLNAFIKLGIPAEITDSPEKIIAAERIVFPGVGAAGSSMDVLRQKGIDKALNQAVSKGIPTLGICVGCQIILESSEEDHGTECLDLLEGIAKEFDPELGLKIPHMGWNQVHFDKEHPIFAGIETGSDFYFVHSFHPVVPEEYAMASTNYGKQLFASVIGKNNLIATQFHTEKSGTVGLQILKNFASWEGSC